MIQRDLSGIKVGLQPGCRLYVRDELIDMMRDLVEMLGIEFTDHPDPRNLFLPFKEGEEGYRVKGRNKLCYSRACK